MIGRKSILILRKLSHTLNKTIQSGLEALRYASPVPLAFTLVHYERSVLAWADSWPGLVCGAGSVRDLEAAIPLAIVEYASWLALHGESVPVGLAWQASESVDSSSSAATAGDPLYRSDLEPLTREEHERFVRHVLLSQEDLRREAAVVPTLLDWVPGGPPPKSPDPWAPEVRTIRGVLTHALQLEVFYREGLRDAPAAGIFAEVAAAEEEHATTVDVLRSVALLGDHSRVFHPLRTLAPGRSPEPAGAWTLRKVFRRLISHNRQHAAEIAARKASILLGGPS